MECVMKIPVACLLGDAERSSRQEAWKLLLSKARERAPIAGGVEVRFGLDDAAEVQRLAAGERECCNWAVWDVTTAAGEVVLRATAGVDPGPLVLAALLLH